MTPQPGEDITRICPSDQCRRRSRLFFWSAQNSCWICIVCGRQLHYVPRDIPERNDRVGT